MKQFLVGGLTYARKRSGRAVGVTVSLVVLALAAVSTFIRQPPLVHKIYLPLLIPQPFSKTSLAWSATHCGDQVVLGIPQRGGRYHRWSAAPNGCKPEPGFVPLWRPSNASEWSYPTSYSGPAAFLNEPDGTPPEGDGLSVEVAASKWLQFRNVCPNCRVIALNLTRGDNTSWAHSWREKVKSWTGSYPNIAGYGVHAYGTREQILNQVEVFCTWMQNTGQGQLQLHVTEFGGAYASHRPQISASDLQTIINEWEYDACVTSYYWFPVRWYKPGDCPPPCSLPDVLFVGSSQTLTQLGAVYRNGASGYPGPQAAGGQWSPIESYP